MSFTPSPRLLAAAAVTAAVLLGTFTQIVHQAVQAGASRHLQPAKAATVAAVAPRSKRAASRQ